MSCGPGLINRSHRDQDKWVRENAASKKASDSYWGQVANVLAQFDGLVRGYNDFAPAGEVRTLTLPMYPNLSHI
jgi:hypothetical protein